MKLKKVINTYYLDKPIRVKIESDNVEKYEEPKYNLNPDYYNYITQLIDFEDGLYVKIENPVQQTIYKIYPVENIKCNEILEGLNIKENRYEV